MAYRFQTDDRTLARGARRIALELCDQALAEIAVAGPPRAEAVHEIRKSVKKLRALLRLVRPGLGDHARLDRRLRDAGRHVSALRDADVLMETLDALGGSGFPAIRAALSAAPERKPAAAAKALGACQRNLAAARRKLTKLSLEGADEAVLAEGLADPLRRGGSNLRAVLHDPQSLAIHDLRKRVKDHLYHARLLAPLWPAVLAPYGAAVDALAENLGLMNDISVFLDVLGRLEVPKAERAEALALAGVRHDRLMLAVLPEAARLLAGSPEDLGARWGAWWSIWQAEGG